MGRSSRKACAMHVVFGSCLISSVLAGGSPGPTCQITATEDCGDMWTQAEAQKATPVVLTFDGDGYFAGAKASVMSTVLHAKTPLLFAVASSSHASVMADWFAAQDWRKQHTLCTIDPRILPEVWTSASEMSAYGKPEHHKEWSSAPSALYRAFLRQLFPRMTRAVYVDADVVVQTDLGEVLAGLSETMALPVSAARSANRLKMRMDFCCQASKKVSKLLTMAARDPSEIAALEEGEAADVVALDPSEIALLEEFQAMPEEYREFNNGVMAFDLEQLEKDGVLERLMRWLRLNQREALLNNDQHAWNLAAWKHWQDLQSTHATNAPSLELSEAALKEKDPVAFLGTKLRGLAFLHYTNLPKPWAVDWTRLPGDVVFDDRIWLEAYLAAGGSTEDLQTKAASTRRLADGSVTMLRPDVSPREHLEYAVLYMSDGASGVSKDVDEARWRFERAAAGGVAEAEFMRKGALEVELKLTDKQRLGKLEACWKLSKLRVQTSKDHTSLRELYKMDLDTYHASRAPRLVPPCYWRLKDEAAAETFITFGDMDPKALDPLFNPADDSVSPPLPPKLSKWLELVGKEEQKAAGPKSTKGSGPAPPPPPVMPAGFEKLLLIPALAVIVGVAGFIVWRVQVAQKETKKQKKSKKKQ